MKTEIQHTKMYVRQQSRYKKEVQTYIGLPQETRKITTNLTLYIKETRKRRKNKAESQQKGGNNKDQKGNK